MRWERTQVGVVLCWLGGADWLTVNRRDELGQIEQGVYFRGRRCGGRVERGRMQRGLD